MSEVKIVTFLSKTGDYEIIIWYNNKLDSYSVKAYCFDTDSVSDSDSCSCENETDAMIKARELIESK